jgi:hypothetical protein
LICAYRLAMGVHCGVEGAFPVTGSAICRSSSLQTPAPKTQ